MGNSTSSTKIPEIGFLRLKQIIGDEKSGIPPIVPVKRSCWLKGVKDGRFPAPVKLSTNVVAWRASDIRELCESL